MVSDEGMVVNKKTWRMLTPKPNKDDGEWEVSLKRDNKYHKLPIGWLTQAQFR